MSEFGEDLSPKLSIFMVGKWKYLCTGYFWVLLWTDHLKILTVYFMNFKTSYILIGAYPPIQTYLPFLIETKE